VKPQGFIPASASPSAHEPADLHVRKVVWVAGVLIGTLVVSILALILFFHHLNREYPRRTSEAEPVVSAADLPPIPRLQTNPLRDLEAVRAVEDSHLNRYAWIDRSHAVAQIPIERAMLLWVKSNASAPAANAAAVLPAEPTTKSAPAGGTTELQMRQQKAQEASHAP
jgi:hypothetical protein